MNNCPAISSSKSLWPAFFQKAYQKASSHALPEGISAKLKKFYWISLLSLSLIGVGKIGYEKWKERNLALVALQKQVQTKEDLTFTLEKKVESLFAQNAILWLLALKAHNQGCFLHNENTLLQEKSSSLATTASSLETNIASLENQNLELQDKAKQREAEFENQQQEFTNTVSSLRTQITSLQEAKAFLEEKIIENSSIETAAKNALGEKIQNLLILLDRKEGEISSLLKEKEELLYEVSFHEAKMNAQKSKITKAIFQKAVLEKENTELKEKVQSLEDSLFEIADMGVQLQQKMKTLEQENTSLRSKQQELEKTLEDTIKILSE